MLIKNHHTIYTHVCKRKIFEISVSDKDGNDSAKPRIYQEHLIVKTQEDFPHM